MHGAVDDQHGADLHVLDDDRSHSTTSAHDTARPRCPPRPCGPPPLPTSFRWRTRPGQVGATPIRPIRPPTSSTTDVAAGSCHPSTACCWRFVETTATTRRSTIRRPAGAGRSRSSATTGCATTSPTSSSSMAGVEPGVRVDAGAPLGTIGTTGRSSACHVHFGISPPCPEREWSVRRGVVWPYRYLDDWRNGGQASPAEEVARSSPNSRRVQRGGRRSERRRCVIVIPCVAAASTMMVTTMMVTCPSDVSDDGG